MKPLRRAGRPRLTPITLPGQVAPPPPRYKRAAPVETAAFDILDTWLRDKTLSYVEVAAARCYRSAVSPKQAGSEIVRHEADRRWCADGVWKQEDMAGAADEHRRAAAHRDLARRMLGAASEELLFGILVRGLTFKAYVKDKNLPPVDYSRKAVSELFRKACISLAQLYASPAGRDLMTRSFKT